MSDIIGLCTLCGKPGAKYTCHLCGRIVCSDCYSTTSATCRRCITPRTKKPPAPDFNHLMK